MPIEIEYDLKYTGAVPHGSGLSQRAFNTIMREAWEYIGKYWMKHFRSKHFTHAGAREYAYNPRKGQPGNPHPLGFHRSYTGRKLAEKKHTLPLVYSGKSREASRRARIFAYAMEKKSGVKIFLNLPTLNLRNPKSHVDMRAEMTRISPREAHTMIRKYERYMEYRLRQFSRSHQTHIKG